MDKTIEARLAKVLGGTYGGPSLSFQDGKFVIYEWGDAPVSISIIGFGITIAECLDDYTEKLEARDR